MSSEESEKDTKIIAIGNPRELLGKRRKTDREVAWEAVAGRDKYDERMRSVDLLFSVGGLKKLGLGSRTISGLVSSGALAYWQGYIKATVGGGGLRDKSEISTKNEKSLSFGLAKYQRYREARTRRNSTTHDINCKKANVCRLYGHPYGCLGMTFAPGAIMFDGQDSEYVKGLALQVLRVLAHQICKSFSLSDMATTVLAPEENKPLLDKYGRPILPGYGYPPLPIDNMKPHKIETVEPKDEEEDG